MRRRRRSWSRHPPKVQEGSECWGRFGSSWTGQRRTSRFCRSRTYASSRPRRARRRRSACCSPTASIPNSPCSTQQGKTGYSGGAGRIGRHEAGHLRMDADGGELSACGMTAVESSGRAGDRRRRRMQRPNPSGGAGALMRGRMECRDSRGSEMQTS